MSKQFEFCRPAAKKVVPSGPERIHGVKYDGLYRGRVMRDCPRDGDDLRKLQPLDERKERLGKFLRGRPEGIFVAPLERGEIGPSLFEAACRMGSRIWSLSAAIGGTGRGPAKTKDNDLEA
jgi:hypothetical protein